MTTYRAVVRHVRWWRGKAHDWSTVYHYSGTTASLGVSDAQAVLEADDGMLFTPGAHGGGTYQCQLYNGSSGGTPIATYNAFDPTNPADWVQPSLAGYANTAGLEYVTAAEVSLDVLWAAGKSKSGKAVHLRKWYHGVGQPEDDGSPADVSGANITSLTAQAGVIFNALGSHGLILSSSTGRLAGDVTVRPYFGNHQMDRGRRRKAKSSSSG